MDEVHVAAMELAAVFNHSRGRDMGWAVACRVSKGVYKRACGVWHGYSRYGVLHYVPTPHWHDKRMLALDPPPRVVRLADRFNTLQRKMWRAGIEPVPWTVCGLGEWFHALGIVATTDKTAITKAYRRRAMATHPDRGGSSRDFMAAKEAHEKLMEVIT